MSKELYEKGEPFTWDRAGEPLINFYGNMSRRVEMIEDSDLKVMVVFWEDGGINCCRQPNHVGFRFLPKPPKRRTVWLNVYTQGFGYNHATQAQADKHGDGGREGPAVEVTLEWDGEKWKVVAE